MTASLLSSLLAISSLCAQSVDPGSATPPEARKIPKATAIHGETLVDDYFWLREKSNPAVIAHLEAENAYTGAVTRPLEARVEALYREMRARIKEADLDVPYRQGEFFYYTRTEQGKQYPLYARKRASLDAPEEVMLDLNELAKGEKFLSVATTSVSDDGNLLAYMVDVTGYRLYALRVKDLRTGALLPDRIEKVNSPVWSADGRTIYYVAEDSAKRPYRLMKHRVGTTGGDTPVFEERDELYRLSASRSKDKKYLFFTSKSSTTSEVRALPADQPDAGLRVILPREEGHEYDVEHRDGLFYLRTNKDAKNFRVVTAPVADPSPSKWAEFIPHRPEVNVARVDLFEEFAVISGREGGLPQIEVHDLKGGGSHRVRFPEPAYAVFLDRNPEFGAKRFRLRYQSLVTPSSVYDYDPARKSLTLLKRTEVLGGYDPANYTSEWTHATATDGTQIPISLVYRKGTKLDGSSPLLLYGYGSYGAPMSVSFNPNQLSLLDRGVIYAQGHIRGGGDLGEPWHDQGKMMAKKNTFTDFIAVADHLVAKGYTSHQKMAIRGASAGGLLIGAVVNMRPDLARVAVLEVPFVDVVNTMLDASLPLTIQEYLEWGNPNIKAEYDYIKTYCPYTNLARKAYPSILVRTSLNDSQVMYWEPAKYVARLRALKLDANPLLLKVNMAAGHGGASGRFDALKEQAFVDAFLLDQLGVPDKLADKGPRFSIRLSLKAVDKPVDGRLLLLVSTDPSAEPRFQVSDAVKTQQVFGVDVEGVAPDGEVIVDSSALGYPVESLRGVPKGTYRVQALFHRYETFARADGHTVKLPMDRGEGQQWNKAPGNLYSTPVDIAVDPDRAEPIAITLDRVIPPIPEPGTTRYIKHEKIESKLLTKFWGRPTHLGAHVLLPEGFDEHPEARYPLVIFHGHHPETIGGFRETPPDPDLKPDYNERFKLAGYNKIVQEHAYEFYKEWTAPKYPRMIIVEIQHANPYYDDSYAVNSANLGPYGDAITYELIPYLEKKYRGIGAGWARFLYGGSTGGWEALAAQVFYPKEYNGCFAACPDPIDFRAYTVVDIYRDKNAYYAEGPWRKVKRPGHRDYLGHIATTLEDMNRLELVLGTKGRSGQQWDIWEAVFSPVGVDGYPRRIWDKRTGVIDPAVAAHWRDHYDLSHILRRDWPKIGRDLEGKIHIYVGEADNFYLNNAVHLVEDVLNATKDPFYGGEVAYGCRDEHCWNGDPTRPIALSRLRYHQMYVPRIVERLLKTAPPDGDVTSWRY